MGCWVNAEPAEAPDGETLKIKEFAVWLPVQTGTGGTATESSTTKLFE
jgi:hypothetical protein